MSARLVCLVCLAGALSLLGFCELPQGRGCAVVSDSKASIRISQESALLVWDEKAKREHFIRRASFETDLPYFGFLVPTPTQPDLGEVSDTVFTQLEDWTKPEVKTEIVYRDFDLLPEMHKSTSVVGLATPSAVQVIDHQQVAGFDAVVLKASDAEKLRQWLEQHGYDARPALRQWLDYYVKKEWYITAFQLAKKEKKSKGLSTQAVRMSFQTEQPFYPYHEPRDPSAAAEGEVRGRSLRVFVVSKARMQGEKEDSPWPGRAAWAGQLDDEKRTTLDRSLQLGEQQIPAGSWLTVFDDASSPRPGTADVYFSTAAEQTELRRPPIIRYKEVQRVPPRLILAGSALVVLFATLIGLWLRRWGKGQAA